MAAKDDSDGRTEMPTQLRLKEARQQGQVARSGDLSSAVMVLGAVGILAMLGPALMDALGKMFSSSLNLASGAVLKDASLGELMSVQIQPVLALLAGIGVMLVVLAITVNVLQVGFLITGHPLRLDLGRLSLSGGLRRIFSSRSLVRGVLSLCKLAVVAIVGWLVLKSAIVRIASMGRLECADIAVQAGGLVLEVALKAAAGLLVLSIGDYIYQRFCLMQDLKMTRGEFLQELRKTEGDPQIRRRRKKNIRKWRILRGQR